MKIQSTVLYSTRIAPSNPPPAPWWRTLAAGALLASVALPAAAAMSRVDIVGPLGSNQFGREVAVLPNGNIVITDPDGVASAVGGVYLYAPDGSQISVLTGSTANDHVGSGGITVLPNGNFLVASPSWHSAGVSVGALTFVNGSTGLSGVVTPANSLVGSTAGDLNNATITPLTNGNFVVAARQWDRGGIIDAGAATWGNGTTGVSGEISISNSLVGSTANDLIGKVTPLPNGNYVVSSFYWDNGGVVDVGAATWASGSTGRTGSVSVGNALIGSHTDDEVGRSVTALANGNYVVSSAYWSNGANDNAGEVALGNGSSGTAGVISAANALVGLAVGDYVGSSIFALPNGNFVVNSPYWNNGAATEVGAVTWVSGSLGKVGAVGTGNSLVGTTPGDKVGVNGITVLSNGNYVVGSQYWHNGAASGAGASTWCSGAVGRIGTVSGSNSLVGTTTNDSIGNNVALTNGNYVVFSSYWNNGAATFAGAATWGNGSTGTIGVVSAANSLVGSQANDAVGSFVYPLANGNYVVSSRNWHNGAAANAGAVTWASGSASTSAVVSSANSLVGSTAGDMVGQVLALPNGNYLVRSINWHNGAATDAGALTWGIGTTGISGPVTPANSLVGTSSGDSVGGGSSIVLSDSNYVVASPAWHNGGGVSVGAATWGNGATGIVGPVSAGNSLVGSSDNDSVGYTIGYANGVYAVQSPKWDNAGVTDAGAVTVGRFGGVTGVISSGNSVIGTVMFGGFQQSTAYDPTHNTVAIGRPEINTVTLIVSGLFSDGFE